MRAKWNVKKEYSSSRWEDRTGEYFAGEKIFANEPNQENLTLTALRYNYCAPAMKDWVSYLYLYRFLRSDQHSQILQ